MKTKIPFAPRRALPRTPVFSNVEKTPDPPVSPALGTSVASSLYSSFNPMLSVGHQLMQARQARGLSIEDVAFHTRIPHPRLRDLENDDLSNFANLTYAKGFLKLYSRYLHLDLSDYLDEFDTSQIADVTGHEYVHTPNSVRLLSAPAFALDDGQRTRLAGNALGIAAFSILLLGGGWIYYKSRPAESSPTPPSVTANVPASPASPANPQGPDNTLAKISTAPRLATAPANPDPAPPKATPLTEDTVRKATIVEENEGGLP